MRIAVTGASGFAGGTIARWLGERGHEVFAYGRRGMAELRAPFPNYKSWDVSRESIAGPDVDAVVHCAAHVGQWGNENVYRSVNVVGTRNVLASFPRAPQVIHLSSASVYARRSAKAHMREDAPIGEPALTPYALTKAEGELLVRASGRAVIILRPHIIYGPGDNTLWPKVKRAARFGFLPVPGNGRNRISVTHVYNLAIAVENALRATPHSATYNISDGDDVTVDELLRTMLKRRGMSARLVYLPRALAWGAASVSEAIARSLGVRGEPTFTRYVVANLSDETTLDITRARTELGFKPRYNFRDAPLD